MTGTELRRALEVALEPVRRMVERDGSGGSQLPLREVQRQGRLNDAFRRQQVRESEREDKRARKESKRLFESLGMTKEQAKLAAKAPFRERSFLEPSLMQSGMARLSESIRMSEAQRQHELKERKLAKAERKELVDVFESIMGDREAARSAARGRVA